jgi:hypothetical protein
MGGGDKSAGKEEDGDQARGGRQGNQEGGGADQNGQRRLHGQQPAPFAGKLVDKGPPEKLEDPGQPEKSGQADRLEAHAAVAEENGRNGADDGEGKPFGEIDAEAPDMGFFQQFWQWLGGHGFFILLQEDVNCNGP